MAALVLTGTALQAQTNNASITATASVQTPINVVGFQQLNFGNVFPGVNKTVAVADLTNAGRFDVTGQASAPVTLSFTLPATLSSGPNTMPIDSYAGVRADNSSQTSGIGFVPGGSNPATLSAAGQLFIWIGARVTPATNQAQGTYTGSITMTVVY
ncbi:MAG TPA: DUF4402 domain-containing protein [Gemmatimonadales bacterium]|nr:DUF4402 domain-containing protein [Gemmatimonadales bacterium]